MAWDSARVTRRTVLRSAATGMVIAAVPAVMGCDPEDTPPTPNDTTSASPGNPLGVMPGSTVEVLLFDGGFGTAYGQHHVELFHQRTDATATLTASKDISGTLQPQLDRQSPPDLVDNSGAQALPVAPLVSAGKIADLQPLLEAPSVDDANVTVAESLRPGVIESGSFDGIVYQLGYAYALWGIWSSSTLFNQRGWSPSRTWDEFRALSASIADETEMAPYVHPGLHPSYQTKVIVSQAVKHGGEDVAVKIDHLEPDAWTNDSMVAAARAWELYVADGFVLAESAELDHLGAQRAWLDGKAATLPCGSWLEHEMSGQIPERFDMIIAPFPALTTAEELPWTAVLGGPSESFLVPAEAANGPGGMEFLRQMISKEGAEAFTRATGSLTSLRDAEPLLDSPSTAWRSVGEMITAAGDDVFEFKYPMWYEKLGAQATTMTSKLMAGEASADEFCAVLQQTTDQLMADPAVKKFRRE